MTRDTVSQGDFDQLSEYFIELTAEYLRLSHDHARLQDTYDRIRKTSRGLRCEKSTGEKLKTNLLGDKNER